MADVDGDAVAQVIADLAAWRRWRLRLWRKRRGPERRPRGWASMCRRAPLTAGSRDGGHDWPWCQRSFDGASFTLSGLTVWQHGRRPPGRRARLNSSRRLSRASALLSLDSPPRQGRRSARSTRRRELSKMISRQGRRRFREDGPGSRRLLRWGRSVRRRWSR